MCKNRHPLHDLSTVVWCNFPFPFFCSLGIHNSLLSFTFMALLLNQLKDTYVTIQHSWLINSGGERCKQHSAKGLVLDGNTSEIRRVQKNHSCVLIKCYVSISFCH